MATLAAGPSTPVSRRAVAVLGALALALAWLVGVPAPASADGPTTFSNSTAIAIPATGSVGQIGPASPYPSTIAVSGMSGAVTTVTVTFAGVTHGTLGDVDALLVAPSGQNLMVLSDAGAVDSFVSASNATLTFSDSAPSQIPTAPGASIPTGSYRPTNGGVGADAMPAPSPAPSTNTTLAEAFTGINPNGIWQLFVVDDTTGDLGQMAGGWSVTITTETAANATTTTVTTSGSPSTTGATVTFTATVTAGGVPVNAGLVEFRADGRFLGAAVPVNASGVASFNTAALTEGTHLIRATYSGATGYLTSTGTVSQRVDNPTVVNGNMFCNTGALTVPQQGASSPYPSNITVSGLTGPVTKVVATLKGLSHAEPLDLDMLLSGPTPTTNLFLLSDAGGANPASNVDLTFDDAAATTAPAPLVTGTYRPTRVADQSADAMPAPAPAPSAATTLATFNGAGGNGTWSLWVVDDASASSGSISGGWCLTITSQAPTTTALTATPNPSQFGDELTFVASVTSAGSPVNAGSVQFSDGATPIGAPVPVAADGTATLTTSALTVGSHTILASYGGTTTLATSSDDLVQVVDLRATATALTSSVNPSSVGDPVTFTATVTSRGAPVTAGSVQFADGATPLGAPVPLAADGTATLTTSALTAGTHTIHSTFGATTTLGQSTDSLDQVVDRAATATAITSVPNPSTFGQSVTVTATVTSGGAPVGGGTVQFRDGSTAIGAPVPVAADGTATVTVADLAAGTHGLVAEYSGTDTYATSSGTLDHSVGQATSSTTVTSSPNPSTFGQSVTFTATVTSGGAPYGDGTVRFTSGATVLCDAVAVAADGTATCATEVLGGGTHTITATFSGTDDVAGSSATVDQVVTPAATTTSVTTSGSSSSLGGVVTFTATVSAGADPVGAGAVEFSVDGGAPGAPVDLAADGTATFETTALAGGTHTITAHFTGTADHAESSGTVSQEVTVDADAGGPYTVAEGGSVTLDATGSSLGAAYGWDLNGDADFTDATGDSPTLTWAQLEALGIDDGPSDQPIAVQVTSGSVAELATTTLSVTNTAPTAVVTGDRTATVGVPFTIKVGADDPSWADLGALFTYTVDWGDGSPVETVTGPADPPVTHTYTAPGDYTASFSATDKDGGESGPTSVTVQAVPAAQTPTPTPTPSTPAPTATETPGGTSGPSDSEGDSDDPSESTQDPSATGTSPGGPLAGTGAGTGLGIAGLGLVMALLGAGIMVWFRPRGRHE